MGTMRITLHTKGPDISFTWKGDSAKLEEAMAAVELTAKHGGYDTNQFARSALHHAVTDGKLWEDLVHQDRQKCAILYFILSQHERVRKELGEDTAVFSAEVTETENGWDTDITGGHDFDGSDDVETRH